MLPQTCHLASPSLPPSSGPPAIIPPTTTAIADTGATSNFFTIDTPVINRRIATAPISIQIPNGATMQSTHEAELDLPALPLAARLVHLVPSIQHSLLSMGQLCDAGCDVIFDAKSVTVSYANQPVLKGLRNSNTKLWHLDLSPTTPTACTRQPAPVLELPLHIANSATGSASPAELVAFTHAALFSPVLSTLQSALDKGYVQGLPGLTSQTLRKYPPQSTAMVKGHLDQTRKNTQSTQMKTPVASNSSPAAPSTVPIAELEAILADAFPPLTDELERSHYCFTCLMEVTGQVATDLTGRFIVPSSNGNNYILILYDYDSNSIWLQPMRSRAAATILEAYKILHTRLCRSGLRPKLQRLDNECSELLKTFLRDDAHIDFQLVPPGNHRRNAAERAVRTAKNHLIAGLCSCNKDFPLHLWDELLPQAELTLNLLRGSRINPKLSAWAQVNGPFDFNRTPIAPPGIRVLAHEKPDNRTTWSPHALDVS